MSNPTSRYIYFVQDQPRSASLASKRWAQPPPPTDVSVASHAAAPATLGKPAAAIPEPQQKYFVSPKQPSLRCVSSSSGQRQTPPVNDSTGDSGFVYNVAPQRSETPASVMVQQVLAAAASRMTPSVHATATHSSAIRLHHNRLQSPSTHTMQEDTANTTSHLEGPTLTPSSEVRTLVEADAPPPRRVATSRPLLAPLLTPQKARDGSTYYRRVMAPAAGSSTPTPHKYAMNDDTARLASPILKRDDDEGDISGEVTLSTTILGGSSLKSKAERTPGRPPPPPPIFRAEDHDSASTSSTTVDVHVADARGSSSGLVSRSRGVTTLTSNLSRTQEGECGNQKKAEGGRLLPSVEVVFLLRQSQWRAQIMNEEVSELGKLCADMHLFVLAYRLSVSECKLRSVLVTAEAEVFRTLFIALPRSLSDFFSDARWFSRFELDGESGEPRDEHVHPSSDRTSVPLSWEFLTINSRKMHAGQSPFRDISTWDTPIAARALTSSQMHDRTQHADAAMTTICTATDTEPQRRQPEGHNNVADFGRQRHAERHARNQRRHIPDVVWAEVPRHSPSLADSDASMQKEKVDVAALLLRLDSNTGGARVHPSASSSQMRAIVIPASGTSQVRFGTAGPGDSRRSAARHGAGKERTLAPPSSAVVAANNLAAMHEELAAIHGVHVAASGPKVVVSDAGVAANPTQLQQQHPSHALMSSDGVNNSHQGSEKIAVGTPQRHHVADAVKAIEARIAAAAAAERLTGAYHPPFPLESPPSENNILSSQSRDRRHDSLNRSASSSSIESLSVGDVSD